MNLFSGVSSSNKRRHRLRTHNYRIPNYLLPKSNPNLKKFLVCGYKGLVFCRGWSMENMDKWLTVQKWVLINQLKIYNKCPKMCLPNLSAQAQYLRFRWKKASLGVRSPWTTPCIFTHSCLANEYILIRFFPDVPLIPICM